MVVLIEHWGKVALFLVVNSTLFIVGLFVLDFHRNFTDFDLNVRDISTEILEISTFKKTGGLNHKHTNSFQIRNHLIRSHF